LNLHFYITRFVFSFILIFQLKWLPDKNVTDIVDCLGVDGDRRRGGSGSLPQSQAENIACSHNWEGMVAPQYECKGIIDTNYARIASIKEDMHMLREQMKNCWREGSRMGEARTSIGMGGPNMGDAGHSMGEDEPTMYHHEPNMYDDQHTMYHDELNMVKEEPRMCQDLSLFWSGQKGHSMSHEDYTTAKHGHAMGLEDPNMG